VTAAGSVVGAGASAVGAYWDYRGAKRGEPVIVTPPIEAYSNGGVTMTGSPLLAPR